MEYKLVPALDNLCLFRTATLLNSQVITLSQPYILNAGAIHAYELNRKNKSIDFGKSCCSRTRRRLLHLCDLLTSPHNLFPVSVFEVLDFLIFILGSLPDLDFHAATNHTYSHRREQIMCSVGVGIDAAIEHSRSIFTDARANHGLSTRMVLDEGGDIMDDAGDGNETAAVLTLFDILIPFHDRQLLERNTPIELGTFLIELLLKLLHATLLDLIGAELFEIVGQADLLHRPDEPLCRVVLPPLNGVAEVAWEFMVEVVVAFAEGDDGRENVIARRVAVVEGLVAQPVGEAVDAEGGLLDEEDAEDAGVDEATQPVVPEQAGDAGREDKTHDQGNRDICKRD